MNQLKTYTIFAAIAFIALLTQTAQAQTVTLGDTPSNPALTRDVDASARRPILVQAWVSLKDGVSYWDYDGEVLVNGFGAGAKPQEIPKGYRFVVEHIWANAALTVGETVQVELSLPLSGLNGQDATYSFALKDGATTHITDGLSTRPPIFRPTYHEAVRLHVDPGDIGVRFSLSKQFTGRTTLLRNVRVYLSGYVEKLPSVNPRPITLLTAAELEGSSNEQR